MTFLLLLLSLLPAAFGGAVVGAFIGVGVIKLGFAGWASLPLFGYGGAVVLAVVALMQAFRGGTSAYVGRGAPPPPNMDDVFNRPGEHDLFNNGDNMARRDD